MSHFEEFKKKLGSVTKCRKATDESIRAYKDKLPSALIEEWQETGWCAYGDGILWLIDPSELQDVVEDWLGPSEDGLVFARSAFGQMLVWNQEGASHIDVLYGMIAHLTDDVDFLFNYMLCEKNFLDSVLNRKLFRSAVKKLGQLEYDECYAFEPALALGGPGTLETLTKAKLREHLGLLAQLRGE